VIAECRIATKNVGRINPESIDDYLASGGYEALKKVLQQTPEEIVFAIAKSGLRGRGGAGFSSGMKIKFTGEAICQLLECMRFIVCNADEGEPGTFKDRIIMEGNPHLYIEGMLIAAYAVSAEKGYIYIRGEYTKSIEMTRLALTQARARGFLGSDILGSGYTLDIELKIGAGSYLCGEELTLLESLEGKRGYPRIKPPYPAEKGLFGLPTLINNVETLAHIPAIITHGVDWYTRLGSKKSPGTKIFTLSGDVAFPGYVEVEMGVTLRELIDQFGGGVSGGKKFKAALLGGAAGTFVPESYLDVPMDYDTLKAKDAVLGSGAVIVMATDKSIREMLKSILRFFQHESCGKCVPCRVGTQQLLVLLEQIDAARRDKEKAYTEMLHHSEIMAKTSLCPLGQSPILAVKSALTHFSHELYSEMR
jgi:NADH:ubiquinone oxidoreductase subunit F (NADH-binding)